MAIRFLPSQFLKKAMPDKAVAKLVTQKLTLNRAALQVLTRAEVLTQPTLEKVALKVIDQYKTTYGDFKDAGLSNAAALEETLNEKVLLLQRVQDAAVFEVSQEIQSKYEGEFYEWLPSDANEPDPEHQLNYGERFQLGVGEAPGDRYGCRCGMNILVNESQLKL